MIARLALGAGRAICFFGGWAVCPLSVHYSGNFVHRGSGGGVFLAREVKNRSDRVPRSCLCLLEYMAINGSCSNHLKWSHIPKIFLNRLIKLFSRSHYHFPLQEISCAAAAFRATCNKCELRAVCPLHTRQRLCTRSTPSTSRA